MIFNPELRRNIWLDFTAHRLILTPIVVGLIAYTIYLLTSRSVSASTAFNLACFFIFLWGTKNASEAVIEEVNNSTWDFQRQSTISPWSMTLGKLIGSTLFSWYAAVICLSIYLFLSTNGENAFSMYSLMANQLSPLQSIMILVIGGLFTQALVLLLSMQVLEQIRRSHTNKTFRYFLSGTILGIIVTNICFITVKHGQLTLLWHNIAFAQGIFAVSSLLIFLAWAIIGLERTFCKELQYQNIPWVWFAFNLYCILYFSGFVPTNYFKFPNYHAQGIQDLEQAFSQAPYYIGFMVAQILTYFALFTDTLNSVRYKKLFSRFKEKNIKETLQQLPWWPISLLLTMILGLLATTFSHFSENFLQIFSPGIFILTSVLFLLRDLVLFHYFYFGKQPQKALGTIILYLFILYMLIPLLLSALSLQSWLPLFLPSAGQHTLFALISVLAQIAFLVGLTGERWKEVWAKI